MLLYLCYMLSVCVSLLFAFPFPVYPIIVWPNERPHEPIKTIVFLAYALWRQIFQILHGQTLPGMIGILPRGREIVIVLLVRVFNFGSVPHGPEERLVVEHLDFVRVVPGNVLRESVSVSHSGPRKGDGHRD